MLIEALINTTKDEYHQLVQTVTELLGEQNIEIGFRNP